MSLRRNAPVSFFEIKANILGARKFIHSLCMIYTYSYMGYGVTLYLESSYIMDYQSIFHALIMPGNTPYNVLYDLIINYNHSYNTL